MVSIIGLCRSIAFTVVLSLIGGLDGLGSGLSLVDARIKPGTGLYTNAVTYCAEAKAVLVNDFDITYYQANHSVSFSISAASVEPNLNLAVNAFVSAYGINIFNLSLNLCDYVQGVLCPLPQLNFTGYGRYPIPTTYTAKIPALAFSVPDLEAFARITLTNVNTGEVAACLQTTLSNGWTVRMAAVQWSSAALFLFALVVALVHSTIRGSSSPATYRWFDVLYLFQTAAALGLLHLNYPSVYLNFALNFSWALGLFQNSNINSAINKLRAKTGGKLSDEAFPAVEYINRKLSPYNEMVLRSDAVSFNDLFASPNPAAAFRSFAAAHAPADLTARSSADLVQRMVIPTVSNQNSTSDLATGIPVYLNSLGIPTANGFDTIFLIYLIAIVVAVGAHVVFFGAVVVLDMLRSKERRGAGWAGGMRRNYLSFCGGNALRLCLIFFFPVTVFAFYQFVIGRSDSWLSILLAVLCLLWTSIPLIIVCGMSIRQSRHHSTDIDGTSPLYTRRKWYLSAGLVYRAYRQRYHFWWFIPLAVGTFIRAGFIGFGQKNQWAQVVGLMVVEFIIFVSCLAFRPHKDRKGDWLGAFMSFCRLAATGLLIAFIPSMGVKPIPRTIIAFVIIVLFGLPAVLLLFGVFWNIGYGLIWRRHKRRIEDGTNLSQTSLPMSDSNIPAMRQSSHGNLLATGGSANLDSQRNSVQEPKVPSLLEEEDSQRSAREAYEAAGNGIGNGRQHHAAI